MDRASASVLYLYRSYLRQSRNLPHLYLRQFFQVRARDDINAILSSKSEDRRAERIKLVHKRIHRIQKANNGDRKSFNWILELAYGRKGKLKWDLLEPIRYPSVNDIPNEPIIPGVEKSRPPVYSPELKALLTSSGSRDKKALDRKDLITPRTLPPRANPNSIEALTFGPFSKRREVNIRRRFFQDELKKILPPLQVTEIMPSTNISKVPMRSLGFQNSGVLQELETLIGYSLTENPPKTRRERRSLPAEQPVLIPTTNLERHPSRWVRRRYRALLARIPLLFYECKSNSTQPFRVEKHPLGHFPHDRSVRTMPDLDAVTMAWIEQKSTTNIKRAKGADKGKE
ncbi:hypothetical protein JR316_0000639 [Psilocybe cubensis]|uniref:LYR motif-containing protein Cup1-like N-terminal domain-containing protein n=2 Tax=Psilocybe cubensis TaxID=181762 RepID=A0A8H7Y7R2_PSICU|nr:hypothetical protein JR316_0000639 [Psilocybe cubensis]KAH9486574.1 hypothetical protein JR316_0000639 [Psilocybe cubensis]